MASQKLSPRKIALVYLVLGGIWVFVSSGIFGWWLADASPQTVVWMQAVNQCLFLLASAIILAVMVRKTLRRLEHAASLMELQGSMIEHAHTGILAVDADQRVIFANPAMARMSGVSQDRIIGRPIARFRSGDHDASFYDQLWQTVDETGVWQGEVIGMRRDFTKYAQWVTITRIDGAAGTAAYYVFFVTDISQQKADQERLRYLDYYDPLTNLPNRVLLSEHLKNALRQTPEDGRQQVAVLFIDLDDFKTINESYGHAQGDKLLQESSERILHCLGEGHELGRFGGDEFVALVTGVTDQQQVEQLASGLLRALAKGFELSDQSRVGMRASIGICLAPGNRAGEAEDVARLFSQADSALSEAKAAGKNTFAFYSDDMTRLARRRLELEQAMVNGLANDEFVLFYQPVYNLQSGCQEGAEALIRWRHPEWGLVSPGEFIPLAEDTGLIVDLGNWVLKEAARQVRHWIDLGLEPGVVAVNVSSRQMVRNDFSDLLRTTIAEAGISPGLLELELTESCLLQLGERTSGLLKRIRDTGVRLAIDDFGTGYSSLSYLHRFDVDKLKIDQSFVHELVAGTGGQGIVKAIIAMGQALGLKVQAEGVEQEDQLEFLAAHGCDSYQGFLRARPMPVEAFESLLPVRDAGLTG